MSISDWDTEFEVIVNRFLEVLGWMGGVVGIHSSLHQIHLIECDEDQDFTYGALCAALAQLGAKEHEWLLEHQFGAFYSLRHTSTLDTD